MQWGVGFTFSVPDAPEVLDRVAAGLESAKEVLSDVAELTKEAGDLKDRHRERKLETNEIGADLMILDKDLAVQQTIIDMAQKDYDLSEKELQNLNDTWNWHRNKVTNDAFFQWLKSEYNSVYYRSYTIVYDMAKKAEQAYRFELGLEPTDPFIQFGFWEANHDGLVAGERLYNGLQKLEQAFTDTRRHDFEIQKSVPLNRIKKTTLDSTGVEFDLVEDDFDRDFPGHYRRRIKCVSLAMPNNATTANLSCTLTLVEHKYRVKEVSDVAAYRNSRQPSATINRDFRKDNVPITAIAVALEGFDSGNAGVFELSFDKDEYLPFEGAGAVSKWRLEFPPWSYQSASGYLDQMVLKLKYTSSRGSDAFKAVVTQHGKEMFRS